MREIIKGSFNMRLLNVLLVIFLMGVGGIFAQSNDSTSEKKQNKEKVAAEQSTDKKKQEDQQKKEPQPQPEKLEGFVDLNANGIDDRIENAGKDKAKGKKQPKDRFVDMDGDGICDGKESAIGLKKLYRKRKGNPHR
jgi:hypothetical protein